MPWMRAATAAKAAPKEWNREGSSKLLTEPVAKVSTVDEVIEDIDKAYNESVQGLKNQFIDLQEPKQMPTERRERWQGKGRL